MSNLAASISAAELLIENLQVCNSNLDALISAVKLLYKSNLDALINAVKSLIDNGLLL